MSDADWMKTLARNRRVGWGGWWQNTQGLDAVNENQNPYQSPRSQGSNRGMNFLLWAKIQFAIGGLILLLDTVMLVAIIASGTYAGLPALFLSCVGASCCILIGVNNLRIHAMKKESPRHEH